MARVTIASLTEELEVARTQLAAARSFDARQMEVADLVRVTQDRLDELDTELREGIARREDMRRAIDDAQCYLCDIEDIAGDL